MDNKGQISAEFLFLIGVMILIVMISIVFIAQEQELNQAMASARNGVSEGLAASSGIYPEDTYREYSTSKTSLMYPYSVEIINISYTDLGYDNNYDKKRIQFMVYAKTSDKFIALGFNTTQSTNNLYNPVFSPHYVYTTANVKWS